MCKSSPSLTIHREELFSITCSAKFENRASQNTQNNKENDRNRRNIDCFFPLFHSIQHRKRKITPLSQGEARQTACCTWNYFDNSENFSINRSWLAF